MKKIPKEIQFKLSLLGLLMANLWREINRRNEWR